MANKLIEIVQEEGLFFAAEGKKEKWRRVVDPKVVGIHPIIVTAKIGEIDKKILSEVMIPEGANHYAKSDGHPIPGTNLCDYAIQFYQI
jgi:hypothetical protein